MLTTVGDILNSNKNGMRTISSADTVATATREMAALNIGALPVVDGGRLVGIFSERDVLKRIVDHRLDPDSTSVTKVMTSNPVSAAPTMRVLKAMKLMSAMRFRHLPVVDDDRLVGMISMGDVTARVIADQGDSIDSIIGVVKAIRPVG